MRIEKRRVFKRDIVILSMFLLFVYDISIIANIPFLKSILGFIFIFYLPGFLLLLQLEIAMSDLTLLSFPFSIALMEIFLYLANSTFKLLRVPFLNKLALLLAVHLYYLIIFVIIFTKHSKGSVKLDFLLTRDIITSGIIGMGLLMFSGYSRWYFNHTSDNYFLWAFLLMIIVVLFLYTLFYGQKDVSMISYSIILYAISLSIYLSYSGTSLYPLGIDVHKEIYVTSTFVNSNYWGLDTFFSVLTSTLFVSLILPAYIKLTDVAVLFVYKYLYFFIISVIPLILFKLYYKILNTILNEESTQKIKILAFISSIVYIFEFGYVYTLQSALRQGAAFLILAAIMYMILSYVLFSKCQLYLILLVVGLVLSHYSTAYIFAIALLISGAFGVIVFKYKQLNVNPLLNLSFLSVILSYLWYWMITNTSYSAESFIKFFVNTLTSGASLKSPALSKTTNFFNVSLPLKISIFTNLVVLGLILLGYLYLIYYIIMKSGLYYRNNVNIIYYLILVSPYVLLVILTVLLPYVSAGYDIDRVYQQTLILGALLFSLGCYFISNILSRIKVIKPNKQKYGIIVISILILSSQLFSVTYAWHDLMGNPYSEFLNSNTSRTNVLIVTPSEVLGVKYLIQNSIDYMPILIYGDSRAKMRIHEALASSGTGPYSIAFKISCDSDMGYYYLREANIKSNSLLFSRDFDKAISLRRCIKFENPKLLIMYNSNLSMILLTMSVR